MNIGQRELGLLLVGFSVILFLILVGVKMDYDKQANFLCDNFHIQQPGVAQCPVHTSNVSWLLVGAFAVSVATLITGIYLAFYKPPSNGKEEIAVARNFDDSQLDEEEKKVYSIITGRGGSTFQGDVVRETGFSKVKVSRILDRLEAKGAIERKRRGMTNLVVQK